MHMSRTESQITRAMQLGLTGFQRCLNDTLGSETIWQVAAGPYCLSQVHHDY